MSWPGPGGRPPRKITDKEHVVEQAPSHDGAPCFTSYSIDSENKVRPPFALRIYDTRPVAGDVEGTRQLALKIQRGTEAERWGIKPVDEERDRIEVTGLPLPADASNEQRFEACKTHHLAEIEARNATGKLDFYIPATYDTYGYWHAFIIIVHLGEGWEDVALNRYPVTPAQMTSEHEREWEEGLTNPNGGFLQAKWGLTELAKREYASDPQPDFFFAGRPIYRLAKGLAELREGMSGFRCFVHEQKLRE
ncbi:hypothetical protein GQ53DRAFT_734602 [Thozetella sp. PMI_491]|nr:hypothetical protein GQ53DRAFT_734602 [Thozetella sp. PMI_491]